MTYFYNGIFSWTDDFKGWNLLALSFGLKPNSLRTETDLLLISQLSNTYDTFHSLCWSIKVLIPSVGDKMSLWGNICLQLHCRVYRCQYDLHTWISRGACVCSQDVCPHMEVCTTASGSSSKRSQTKQKFPNRCNNYLSLPLFWIFF